MQLGTFIVALMAAIHDVDDSEKKALEGDLAVKISELGKSEKPSMKKIHGIISGVWFGVFLTFIYPFVRNFFNSKLAGNASESEEYADDYDPDDTSSAYARFLEQEVKDKNKRLRAAGLA